MFNLEQMMRHNADANGNYRKVTSRRRSISVEEYLLWHFGMLRDGMPGQARQGRAIGTRVFYHNGKSCRIRKAGSGPM